MAGSLKWSSLPQCVLPDCAKHCLKVPAGLPGSLCWAQSTCVAVPTCAGILVLQGTSKCAPAVSWETAVFQDILFFSYPWSTGTWLLCSVWIHTECKSSNLSVHGYFVVAAALSSLSSRCLQLACGNAEMWLMLDVGQNRMYRLSFLFAFLIKCLLWWCSSKTWF